MSARSFEAGDRVLVNNEKYPDFWANGATGVVTAPPQAVKSLADGWSGIVRSVRTVRGVEPYYWVVLDEARLDGDGDGPYGEAELAAAWLRPL
jgi:hypothetical protein